MAHQEEVVVQRVPAPLAELKGAGGDFGAVLSWRQLSKERAARCGALLGPRVSEQPGVGLLRDPLHQNKHFGG